MRKFRLTLSLLLGILGLCDYVWGSYGYPPEWKEYTLGGYLFDIESDSNSKNLSETFFKNQLLDIARANLAKQIELKIQDYAQMNTTITDGHSHGYYNSETKFNTATTLKFVETQAIYDANKKEGAVIAYISRERIRNFYANELLLLNNKIESAIAVAQNYISEGLKTEAKAELETAQTYLPSTEEPLFWMNVFETSSPELNQCQDRIHRNTEKIKQLLAEQKYSTRIYLRCEADLFGSSYTALEKELTGLLANDGCWFSEETDCTDWIIHIRCSSRESTCVATDNANIYFAYVDAAVKVEKGRRKCIWEDVISEKGGSIHSYHAAAEAAYKQISKTLSERLKQTMRI